ncbi:hypothetical protein Bbelb_163140 [Branchiostoma belcheri]|nr:hypothetical protein Bbelb_163140 [Branchiostoma belcheri]
MTTTTSTGLSQPANLKTDQSEEIVYSFLTFLSSQVKSCADWEKPVMTLDFCANQTRSGVCTCPCRCVLRVGCSVWEKPVDLKMQKEMKTAGTVVIVDPKTGLQLRRKNWTS